MIFYKVESIRRVRVNTVAFDVECVILFDEEPNIVDLKGLVFRRADIDKWFIPNEMVDLTTANTERMGYISVFPYTTSHFPTLGLEIDPNLTHIKDTDELADYRHYKHHARTLPLSEMGFTLPVGADITAIVGHNYFTPSTTHTAAYDWFNLTNSPTEIIVFPFPSIVTPGEGELFEALKMTVNLAYIMPDCAMRNAIYSNYQVIRGNEYGVRESVIDFPLI